MSRPAFPKAGKNMHTKLSVLLFLVSLLLPTYYLPITGGVDVVYGFEFMGQGLRSLLTGASFASSEATGGLLMFFFVMFVFLSKISASTRDRKT
ncbi:MAG: hypothetical protein LBO00_03640 [Zoogloeaceae bacterium]|jgi:hypothetical protein|nr:hypothetical protein [Zoogloeaceae bacterium]